MKIKGLENGSYYFSNPVFVNASGLTRGLKIEASYQGKTYNFYYTHFGGRVQVDISEIVKGITPRIKSLKEIEKIYDIITGSTITFLDGSYKITFVFYDATETNISRFNIVPIVINCTFLKGGKLAYQNNIPTKNNLSIGNVFYEGFPNYDFTFQNDLIKGVLLNRDSKTYDDIVYTSHLNNPIFLLFRNSLGGLSRLLFESFEKKISISNSDSFILPNNIAVDVGRPRISFNCKTQLKNS